MSNKVKFVTVASENSIRFAVGGSLRYTTRSCNSMLITSNSVDVCCTPPCFHDSPYFCVLAITSYIGLFAVQRAGCLLTGSCTHSSKEWEPYRGNGVNRVSVKQWLSISLIIVSRRTFQSISSMLRDGNVSYFEIDWRFKVILLQVLCVPKRR